MTEKLTENSRACAINRAGRGWPSTRAKLLGGLQPCHRCRSACLVFAALFLLGGLGSGVLQAAKPKTDKFEGMVVVVGPKAITVKSRDNIYMVRTFHYSAELEQKMLRKKPETGKKVTVHYVRGSDLALKVDD
jgi:hypothetical protein